MHVLPDGLREMLLVELTIYREALCAMTRRPRPSERVARSLAADARFTLQAGPISSVLMPLLLIGTFLELPLLHLAIHVKAAPAMRLSLHVALVGLTAWGLVWLFGDRSARQAGKPQERYRRSHPPALKCILPPAHRQASGGPSRSSSWRPAAT
jgi:hypothetical protein